MRRSGFLCGATFCCSQRENSRSSPATGCWLLPPGLSPKSGATNELETRSNSAWVMVCGAPSSSTISLYSCLLYTSDAADDLLCVDLGGRRIIKKKKKQ